MAHQSAGGFPSGDPSKDGPLNKRPVPLSSEKGNQQPNHPAHRSVTPNALMFPPASPGPAASIVQPPVSIYSATTGEPLAAMSRHVSTRRRYFLGKSYVQRCGVGPVISHVVVRGVATESKIHLINQG